MTPTELMEEFVKKSGRAAKVRIAEEVYIASGYAVFQRRCLPEEMLMVEGQCYPYGNKTLWKLKDPMSMRQEAMLETDRLEIPAGEDRLLFKEGMGRPEAESFGLFSCIEPDTGEPRLWFANLLKEQGLADTVMSVSTANTEFLKDIPIRISMPQPEVQQFFSELQCDPAGAGDFMVGESKIRIYFCILRLMRAIGIRIEDETTAVTLAPLNLSTPGVTQARLCTDGLVYAFEGWDSTKFTYKTIKRVKGQKKTMKNASLSIPPASATQAVQQPVTQATPVAPAAAVKPVAGLATPGKPPQVAVVAAAQAQPAEDLNGAVAGVDDVVPTFEEQPSVAVSITTGQPEEPSNPGGPSTPAPEAAGGKPAEPAQEKTAGTRTRKPPKAIGFDFAKTLEYLGSPVPELSAEEMPQAIEELRMLRDLMIAASRRSANIALGISENAGTAIKFYAQVRAIVPK